MLLGLGVWSQPSAAESPPIVEPTWALPALTAKHGDLLRLYWASFGREPDTDGALYWMERQERCDSLVGIADLFASSAEFELRYGAAVDDPGFVDIVYQNVLGRTPDDEGAEYWTDLLTRNVLTRGGVILYVSQSIEFRSAHPYPSDGKADQPCALPGGAPTPRSSHYVEGQIVASAGPVEIAAPVARAELAGFHQSTHPGAQQMSPGVINLPTLTMENRGRGTGSRTALDFAANPLYEVQSPVTGTVLRSGTYDLYCYYTDEFVAIAPDSKPEWEVKILHVAGLYVQAGDRVTVGQPIASHSRTLPLRSQIDAETASPSWPHVHIEIVDPSIPGRPSGSC